MRYTADHRGSHSLSWVFVSVAFVAYMPATVLLGRAGELRLSPVIAYGAPLVGVLLFGPTYWFWRHELNAYQSAGH